MWNEIQLFCFTHAGGTTAFFDVIERDLRGVDCMKLEYAGHGSRRKVEPYRDFSELADDMHRLIASALDGRPYALFGYSMGSISLVETLRRIEADAGMPMPVHAFIAAHAPRTKEELRGFCADEDDAWVKRRTIDFGAVPDELVENKTFWRMYLPLYRADYSLIGTYSFDNLAFTTKVPATMFYSEADTPYSEMLAWRDVFADACDFHRFEGTHFFIRQHHEIMAKIMLAALGVENDVR